MKDKLRKNKFLRNKKSFLFLLILCLGVGFAFLSTQLNITGNTSVSGNKWSVYFDNVEVSEGSVDASVVPTTTGTTTTSIEYTVNLDKPGDFYEFTVDAVNAGTIDAVVESINMTSLDTDVAKYLSYTATYEDGTTLAQNDVLKATKTDTYKVRVEYKKNIEASDLDEDGVNLTLTFGVNYVQSNIKPKQFVELVKNTALSDSSINFGQISSDENGKGLYLRSGTENSENPIYYYRGNVNNNNAMFAGYCWRIVRTTETGGTKLIYNGVPRVIYKSLEKIDKGSYVNVQNDENYLFEFDETSQEWINSNITNYEEATISFSVKEAGYYVLNYSSTVSDNVFSSVKIYKDGELINSADGTKDATLYFDNLSTSSVFSVKYSKSSYEANGEGNITFSLSKGKGKSVVGCLDVSDSSVEIGKSKFNTDTDSMAYVGYMYGNVYQYHRESYDNSSMFGNSFTYSNGEYTLTNTNTGIENSHRYTCFNTTGKCSEISYVYYYYSYTYGYNSTAYIAYYINLTGGKSVEDAISDMKENNNNSTMKTTLENWFQNSFIPFFITDSKDYNDYLEDTVWCNDRKFNTINAQYIKTFEETGWSPNTTGNAYFLYFESAGRVYSGAPSLTCSSKNDSFTVQESTTGNGKLTYPVGLLTSDEVMFAGGRNKNTSYYLYTDEPFWTMSVNHSDQSDAWGMIVKDGYLTSSLGSYGVRPSISLKPTVKIAVGGNGSSTSPYEFVVE